MDGRPRARSSAWCAAARGSSSTRTAIAPQLFDLASDPARAPRPRRRARACRDARAPDRARARRLESRRHRRAHRASGARDKDILDAWARNVRPPRRVSLARSLPEHNRLDPVVELMRAARAWPRLGPGLRRARHAAAARRAMPTPKRVIAAAIDRGIRFFDVAPLYGGGLAEERLGRALRGAAARRIRAVHEDRRHAALRADGRCRPAPRGRRQFDRWDYSAAATRASVEREPRAPAHGSPRRRPPARRRRPSRRLPRSARRARAPARRTASSARSASARTSRHRWPRCSTARAFDAFLLAGCYTLLDQSGARADRVGARARHRAWSPAASSTPGVLAAWPQPAPTFGYRPAEAACSRAPRASRASASDTACRLRPRRCSSCSRNPAIDTVLLGPRTVAELDANLAAVDVPDSRRAVGRPRGCARVRGRATARIAARAERSRLGGRLDRCASTPTCTSGSRPAASTTGRRRSRRLSPRLHAGRRGAAISTRARIDGVVLVQTCPQSGGDRLAASISRATRTRCAASPAWVDLDGRAVRFRRRWRRGPKSSAFAPSCAAWPMTRFVARPHVRAPISLPRCDAGLNVTILAEARHYGTSRDVLDALPPGPVTINHLGLPFADVDRDAVARDAARLRPPARDLCAALRRAVPVRRALARRRRASRARRRVRHLRRRSV